MFQVKSKNSFEVNVILQIEMSKVLLRQPNSCAISVREFPEEITEFVFKSCFTQDNEERLKSLDTNIQRWILETSILVLRLIPTVEHHQGSRQGCLRTRWDVQNWRVVGSNLLVVVFLFINKLNLVFDYFKVLQSNTSKKPKNTIGLEILKYCMYQSMIIK